QVLIGFPDEKKSAEVSKTFSDAGINLFSGKDISKEIWEKFIFGSTVSSVGSIENDSFGEIISKPERKKLLSALISELLSIAEAKGIHFDKGFKDSLLEKIASYPASARTSMQLDFANGKRTEIESFTGYVVRLGEEMKIEVPNYRIVYELLLKK
ncbi:MAG TPA: ketopantoate reductase C-terminal domain-containing protein, partial [Bacteroidia bacterium]|nr:ketopantoate reductase C-terminal domain-containing protein [Bacteroidia bacterium]